MLCYARPLGDLEMFFNAGFVIIALSGRQLYNCLSVDAKAINEQASILSTQSPPHQRHPKPAMALQSSQHSHTRLEVELEVIHSMCSTLFHHPLTHSLTHPPQFLQCLANPFYLNYLSHTKVLDDERFLNYLAYLEYFRAPEYAKLLACVLLLV